MSIIALLLVGAFVNIVLAGLALHQHDYPSQHLYQTWGLMLALCAHVLIRLRRRRR